MRRLRTGFGAFIGDLHQEYRFEISAALFVLGIVLVFFALLAYVPQAKKWAEGVAVLQTIIAGLGPWVFWEAILAALVILVGGFDFGDTVKKAREFEKLINTTSKEVFLKNRARIEHLAENDLPERYSRRVDRKRLDLKVRD